MHTPEAREKGAAAGRTPEAREAARQRAIEYWRDNSVAHEVASERTLRWIIENPEKYVEGQEKSIATRRTLRVRKANSERRVEHYEDPVNRLVASTNQRRYLANDPDTGGDRVPGGLRDAYTRARVAYVAEEKG